MEGVAWYDDDGLGIGYGKYEIPEVIVFASWIWQWIDFID